MQKLKAIIKELISLFASDPSVQDYFSSEINWLEQRLSIWEQQTWRVALIGLTSSGKSTLVNALLANNLLPTRVRPSSNSLVICRWGKEAKALIHYEDKPSESIGSQILETRFSELTDEEMNPDNVKGVKEIELYWPGFKLGKNIALVDTPGLDAYQLERHEELTMQLLLPTVDAVIFLTTAKANADSRIADYLDIIGSHEKPVIFVQNMIDSIEPKLGSKGIVVRSKAEVADDHRKRLRKLLERGHQVVRSAPIVQISAEWALQEKFEESKIPNLLQTVNESVNKLMPRLVKGRYQQLITELSKVVKREEASTSATCTQDYFLSEKKRLNEQRQKVEILLKDFHSDIAKMLVQVKEQASEMKSDARMLKPNDCEKAMRLKYQVEKWFVDVPKALGQLTKGFQDAGRELAKELNLSVEDLRMEKTKGPAQQSANVQINRRKKIEKKEKSGFFSGVARFLGLGGYDYKTVESKEVNVHAFFKAVGRLANAEIEWMQQASSTVKKNADNLSLQLIEEIDRSHSNLEKKQEIGIEAEKRLKTKDIIKTTLKALKKDLSCFQVSDSNFEEYCADLSDVQKTIELPRYVHTLIELSHQRSSKRFITMRQFVLSRISRNNPAAVKRVLIWGFDGDSLERFINRFFYDSIVAKPFEKKTFQQIQNT
jgi:GTPase Era involved in 16S rRNA processing